MEVRNDKGQFIAGTCSFCGNEFEKTHSLTKYCSDQCRCDFKNLKRRTTRVKVERVKKPVISKPIIPKERIPKKTRRSEKVLAENMPMLNKMVKHDGYILKAKNIISPDLSQVEYKHYDPALRATRFFKNKERYDKFLETLKK